MRRITIGALSILIVMAAAPMLATPGYMAHAPEAQQNAVAAECIAPPLGLVSWWPGDGNPYDYVGGNHGTLQFDASYGYGMVEEAFSFDGEEDWVSAPGQGIANLQELTMELWVNHSVPLESEINRYLTLTMEKAVLRHDNGYLHFYMNMHDQGYTVGSQNLMIPEPDYNPYQGLIDHNQFSFIEIFGLDPGEFLTLTVDFTNGDSDIMCWPGDMDPAQYSYENNIAGGQMATANIPEIGTVSLPPTANSLVVGCFDYDLQLGTWTLSVDTYDLQHIWVPYTWNEMEFHHVAGTYDGQFMKLYMDGVNVGQLQVSGPVIPGAGVEIGSGWEELKGCLDEISIYDRALSAQEIQEIFEAGSAGKCKPEPDYFVYSTFNPDDIGDVVAVGGYVEYQGLPEWGDEIQYVYFLSGDMGYKVRTWVTDGDGDGVIEPYQHPDHYLSQYVGPIEPRHFEIVSSATLGIHTAGSQLHSEEFYIDSSGVYLGAYPNGINKWDHDWNYVGKIAESPPERTESLAFNPTDTVWFAGGRFRTIYELRDTNSDGSFLDEIWTAIFSYPDYGGNHHDGMEFAGGYLWISDMTSDVIGKWKLNTSSNMWIELDRYSYLEPGHVEGMGFGPNDHFWCGSGWDEGAYLYEIGNEITRGYPIARTNPDIEARPPLIPVTLHAWFSHHTDPTKQIVQYEWDFESDGIWDYVGAYPQVSHAYPAYYHPDGSIDWSGTAKDYTATLRVTDNSVPALTDTDTCIVHITAPPWRPVADSDGPYEGYTNVPVELDGSGSFDPESQMYPPEHPWYETIATYQWDLDGDGAFDDGFGPNPTYTWTQPGLHVVCLRVIDSAPSGPGGTIGTLDVGAMYTTVVIKPITVVNLGLIPVDTNDDNIAQTRAYYLDIGEKITDYYLEASYEGLYVNVEILNETNGNWFALPLNTAQYSVSSIGTLIDDAIDSCDDDVDFRRYDPSIFHGRGVVAFVTPFDVWGGGPFISTARGAGGYYSTDDGTNVDVIIIHENRFRGMGRVIRGLAHEFAHALGKILVTSVSGSEKDDSWVLPDLYLRGNVNSSWGLMGSLSGQSDIERVHLTSYTKEWLGWLNYRETEIGHTYTILPLAEMSLGDDVLRYSYDSTLNTVDFYIMELRSNDPRGSHWDRHTKFPQQLSFYQVDVRDDSSASPEDQVNLVEVLTETGSFSDPDIGVSFALRSISWEEAEIQVRMYLVFGFVGAVLRAQGDMFDDWRDWQFPESTGDIPQPDLDLHAHTESGLHVGMNYETGEYENQIPGAMSSGDLVFGREWIFVPEDIEVQYSVSSRDIERFFEAVPEARELMDDEETFYLDLVYYDDEANRWESDRITELIESGKRLVYSPSISENPDGSFTVSMSSVPQYTFSGFLPPINPDGSSTFKRGWCVPVKFSLFDDENAPVSTVHAILELAMVIDGEVGDFFDAIPKGTANDGNIFRYDSEDELYIYNLNTKRLRKRMYILRVTLENWQTFEVVITLR